MSCPVPKPILKFSPLTRTDYRTSPVSSRHFLLLNTRTRIIHTVYIMLWSIQYIRSCAFVFVRTCAGDYSFPMGVGGCLPSTTTPSDVLFTVQHCRSRNSSDRGRTRRLFTFFQNRIYKAEVWADGYGMQANSQFHPLAKQKLFKETFRRREIFRICRFFVERFYPLPFLCT